MKNGLILSLGVMTGLVTAFDGGMILANQMVGDKQYSEAEFQEYGEQQREEGYNEGLTVNVGYSEEDLQNAYEQGKAEMEELLQIITNSRILYSGAKSNLIYDARGIVEGLVLQNLQTNEYTKVIPNGTGFSYEEHYSHPGSIYIKSDSIEGFYVLKDETCELVQVKETGKWRGSWSQFSNGAIIRPSESEPSTAEGLYYFDYDNMELIEISSTGKAWQFAGDINDDYNFWTADSSFEGMLNFNCDTKEITTVLTEGYDFDYNSYQMNTESGTISAISCALGICKINDDKTLTILLPTENGEKWQFDGVSVINSTSMYYWNNTAFEELELGVVPTQIVNLGFGYAVYNNEEKLVIISSSLEVITIETPGENIELEDVLTHDHNNHEWLAYDTNGVLYKINYSSCEKEVVKDFGSGDVGIYQILNGAIDGDNFIFFYVDNYNNEGLQDLYGYKNGELTLFAEDCFNIYCEDTNDTTGTFVCQTSDGEERITIDYATFTIVE